MYIEDDTGVSKEPHEHPDWSELFRFAMMALAGKTEDLEATTYEARDMAASAGLIADAAVAEIVRRKGWSE